MKKRVTFILLSIMLLSCTVFFTACGETKHTHTFDRQVAEQNYLYEKATCVDRAKYYYSCECGEKGTETFEYSEPLGHSFTNYISDDNATYEKDGTKTARCDREGCAAIDTITDEGSKLDSYMSFKTLSVNGNKVYGKVSNATESFSFINEIEAVGLVKYVVSFDIYGSQQIATKTIDLNVGDNTVYVTELFDGEPKTLYEVTVRRRPLYSITFDSNGGTAVDGQTVEEDAIISKPVTTRLGYAFVNWSYDFSTPIIKDTTATATWNIITYNISYNLNGGTIEDENPTTYTVEDEINLVNNPIKYGYNFENWDNGGKIEKGSVGDKTFNASYVAIIYKITYDCGNGINNSRNPRKYTIESETIVFKDAYYINADFVEWQQGNVKVTEIVKGSIGDVMLTAVWNEYDVKLQRDNDCYTVIGLNSDKTDIIITCRYLKAVVTHYFYRLWFQFPSHSVLLLFSRNITSLKFDKPTIRSGIPIPK